MLHGGCTTVKVVHVMLFLLGAQLCPKCFSYVAVLCSQWTSMYHPPLERPRAGMWRGQHSMWWSWEGGPTVTELIIQGQCSRFPDCSVNGHWTPAMCQPSRVRIPDVPLSPVSWGSSFLGSTFIGLSVCLLLPINSCTQSLLPWTFAEYASGLQLSQGFLGSHFPLWRLVEGQHRHGQSKTGRRALMAQPRQWDPIPSWMACLWLFCTCGCWGAIQGLGLSSASRLTPPPLSLKR